MDKNSLWVILAIVMMFFVAIVHKKYDDKNISKTDFEIVEKFTKDIVKTIIDDSTYNVRVNVIYIGKDGQYDIFKAVSDSLPNGFKRFELSVGLNEEDKDLYILSK